MLGQLLKASASTTHSALTSTVRPSASATTSSSRYFSSSAVPKAKTYRLKRGAPILNGREKWESRARTASGSLKRTPAEFWDTKDKKTFRNARIGDTHKNQRSQGVVSGHSRMAGSPLAAPRSSPLSKIEVPTDFVGLRPTLHFPKPQKRAMYGDLPPSASLNPNTYGVPSKSTVKSSSLPEGMIDLEDPQLQSQDRMGSEIQNLHKFDKPFYWKTEPLTNRPRQASHFSSHPTLTNLPPNFTSPPLSKQLKENVSLMLAHLKKPGTNVITPTPIQRLSIGHFLTPRKLLYGKNPPRRQEITKVFAEISERDGVPERDELPRGISKNSQTLMAAETGSGKTIAYALPIIQNIAREKRRKLLEEQKSWTEEQWASHEEDEKWRKYRPDAKKVKAMNSEEFLFSESKPEVEEEYENWVAWKERRLAKEMEKPEFGILKPKAIIIAPTHELARQISETFKALSAGINVSTLCLSSGRGQALKNITYGYDVVVGTVGVVRDAMGLSTMHNEMVELRRNLEIQEDISLRNMTPEKRQKYLEKHGHPIRVRAEPDEALGIDDPLGVEEKEEWMEEIMGIEASKKNNAAAGFGLRGELEEAGDEDHKTVEEVVEDENKERDRAAMRVLRRRRLPVVFDKPKRLLTSELEWFCADEADIMLNEDFATHTMGVLQPALANQSPPKVIFCSATIPPSLDQFLLNTFPSITRLTTPHLHQLPHNLKMKYVPWTSGNWTADVLLQIRTGWVEDARKGEANSKTLVFINRKRKAEYLKHWLAERGFLSTVVTGDSDSRIVGNNQHLDGFITSPYDQLKLNKTTAIANIEPDQLPSSVVLPPKKSTQPNNQNIMPESRILITTSLLARGIDFSPDVKSVLLIDTPNSAMDLIHRAGRTGRAGRMGEVVVFTRDKHMVADQYSKIKRGGPLWKVEARMKNQRNVVFREPKVEKERGRNLPHDIQPVMDPNHGW